MNMVLNFHARLPVRSLFRHYTCIDCNAQERRAFVEGKDYAFGKLPETPQKVCGKCGGEQQPVEADDEFFQFLVA